jgi:hypothetical protein
MLHTSLSLRTLALALALALVAVPGRAQTVDDGVLVDRGELRTGYMFTFDTWTDYWEGARKRRNGNIGTITTQVNSWVANYGVTDRLNVIADVPHVATGASQGVLHGSKGLQDLTVSAKYQLFRHDTAPGVLRAFAVFSLGVPLTDYNLELLPLSLGLGGTRVGARGTLNLHARNGLFVNGSAAYTWRGDVTLDRPYYFTDGEFVMSDEVEVPEAVDYIASSGFMNDQLMLAGFLTQQFTQGGGDIRRQDMPLPSHRMNVTRVGGMAMVPVPGLSSLVAQVAVARTLTGRNVGEASTFSAGLVYRFNRRTR